MMRLPSNISDIRRLVGTLDLGQMEAAIANEAQAQLVIVGPVNSGKSTLFNTIKGQKLSPVSAVPGTTRQVIGERFGPFWLVDTPGMDEVAGHERATAALSALDNADVVVLVLDCSAGVRQADANLYQEIKERGLPVVVALNKIDLIKRDLKQVISDAEHKLRVPVIPISAKKGTGVADKLIPAMVDSHPQMAVTIGRALPRYRKVAASRIIRESAWMAALIGGEPIPALEIPLVLAVQVRMILRLAAVYGATMGVARALELMSAIGGGLLIRYAGQEVAKIVPGFGWLAAGAVAFTGTTALGNVATLFFNSSEKLTPQEMRQHYRRLRWSGKPPDGSIDEDVPQN